ncbi:MAG: metallophosphoesterase family protein, partial [Nitrospirota bacterium]|nr:metallophosphoesterase family protein [Nitrospirota bacterium]
PSVNMIISGHSHKPAITTRNGIVFLNPGSAGPRRFTLPIALARISVDESQFMPELIHLEI